MVKLKIVVIFALITFALFLTFAASDSKMIYADKQILITSDDQILSGNEGKLNPQIQEDEDTDMKEEEVEIEEEKPGEYMPDIPEDQEETEE